MFTVRPKTKTALNEPLLQTKCSIKELHFNVIDSSTKYNYLHNRMGKEGCEGSTTQHHGVQI